MSLEYTIVTAARLNAFLHIVNNRLRDGWTLVGGPFYTKDLDDGPLYHQALVYDRKEPLCPIPYPSILPEGLEEGGPPRQVPPPLIPPPKCKIIRQGIE